MSIAHGELPSEWKLALIIPIPKPGEKTDPANYRPISLPSILSNKRVQNCLQDHLKVHYPISDKQWGFTKERSTTGPLLTAVDSWHRYLEAGFDTCAVFFDLKKAFDSVSQTALLNKS